MKKLIKIICTIFVLFTFSGCKSAEITKQETKKFKIITTIYPEYDWVKNIVKDSDTIDVQLLLNNGIDLHNYQPSAQDILDISNSDMFIYVGGESDKWVDDVLKNAKNQNLIVVNLLESLGPSLKEEEIKEGMSGEDHEHDEDHEHEEDHDHEHEYDEHVWLSLKNAALLTNLISEKIQELDKDNASIYKENTEKYVGEINKLDKEYMDVVSTSKTKTLLFGDRFPFRYMIEDYDLDYYAAFLGCSTDSEASFETIKFLSNKLDELNLKYVLKIETGNDKIAKTIIENSKNKDQKILELNSIQSVINDDESYLTIMENNLKVLKEALK